MTNKEAITRLKEMADDYHTGDEAINHAISVLGREVEMSEENNSINETIADLEDMLDTGRLYPHEVTSVSYAIEVLKRMRNRNK